MRRTRGARGSCTCTVPFDALIDDGADNASRAWRLRVIGPLSFSTGPKVRVAGGDERVVIRRDEAPERGEPPRRWLIIVSQIWLTEMEALEVVSNDGEEGRARSCRGERSAKRRRSQNPWNFGSRGLLVAVVRLWQNALISDCESDGCSAGALRSRSGGRVSSSSLLLRPDGSCGPARKHAAAADTNAHTSTQTQSACPLCGGRTVINSKDSTRDLLRVTLRKRALSPLDQKGGERDPVQQPLSHNSLAFKLGQKRGARHLIARPFARPQVFENYWWPLVRRHHFNNRDAFS